MKESAADIQQYLNIIQGDFLKKNQEKDSINENHTINLGVATGGANVGSKYIFDNGLRWLKVLDESDQFWIVEHGFLEYDADSRELLSKHDLARMISRGEMVFEEIEELDGFLLETPNDEDGSFNIFMEKVDKFLLVNYQLESQFMDYDWSFAFDKGLTPFQAVEEAVLLEG